MYLSSSTNEKPTGENLIQKFHNKPINFDGNVNNNKLFMLSFILYIFKADWDDDQKIQILVSYLTKEAAEWVCGMMKTKTFWGKSSHIS
jgi:hypothetical protein